MPYRIAGIDVHKKMLAVVVSNVEVESEFQFERRMAETASPTLFRKERVERELDDELRGFLEMAAEEKMKQGMSRRDALRAVRLDRGNLDVTKEVVRSAGWESFLETCWQDLHFGLRMLRKSPGFTVTAAISITLGIGATTAVFSVIFAVLINPYPYAGADRMVRLTIEDKAGVSNLVFLTGSQYAQLRQTQSVESVLGHFSFPLGLRRVGDDPPVPSSNPVSGS